MPKGSEELTNARKEEIIDACASLYETKSFRDITIRDIGEKTSFTRTSIYNYYHSKEEIFLAHTEKQIQAMKMAHVHFISYSIYELVKPFAVRLLQSFSP